MAPVTAVIDYTPTDILMMLGGVVTIIAAISSMLVAVITAWNTGRKVDVVHSKLNDATGTVDQIKSLTDGNFSRQSKQIDALLMEVQELRSHIAEQEKTRAVLAAEARKEGVIAGEHLSGEFTITPTTAHPTTEGPRIITP